MNHPFDELIRNITPSATRRGAPRKCSPGCASLTLLLAVTIGCKAATLSPLVALSRPNAVGTCDDNFVTLPGSSMGLDDSFEPFMAVNPVDPRNIVVVWTQGLLQNIIAAVSLNSGRTWQHVPVPFTVCS